MRDMSSTPPRLSLPDRSHEKLEVVSQVKVLQPQMSFPPPVSSYPYPADSAIVVVTVPWTTKSVKEQRCIVVVVSPA
jgi:hypothetical protein